MRAGQLQLLSIFCGGCLLLIACGSVSGGGPGECQTQSDCNDNNACNGLEVCLTDGECAGGTPPDCNDNNDCTADACDAQGGCTNTLIDVDGDGAAPATIAGCGTDCNDNDASINPQAIDAVGDGVDQNCDGAEQCLVDADNDGYRTTDAVASADADCTDDGEALATEPAGDCADNMAAINPGATEVVGDGIDSNCDLGESCYADVDNDGYRLTTTVVSADFDCLDPGEAVATDPTGDCNDNNIAINPLGTELTGDEVDQNCDNAEVCYVDGDGDGYRLTTTVASSDVDCDDMFEGEAADPTGDCNDGNINIRPGAAEVAGDEIDQNCDNMESCYVDGDNDGYRLTTLTASADVDCQDNGEATAGEPTGDCNDGNGAVRPNATEVCFNSTDDNCSGAQDEAAECSIACNWSGARWLSHGHDSGNAFQNGAWVSCINSSLTFVDSVTNVASTVNPTASGTSDPIVGCSISGGSGVWTSSTRWASQGIDGLGAFTNGTQLSCDSSNRVTTFTWDQNSVTAQAAQAGQLGCDWTGAIWLTHGWDGGCAYQTGIEVTCNNSRITHIRWVETSGCARNRI